MTTPAFSFHAFKAEYASIHVGEQYVTNTACRYTTVQCD